MNKLFGFGETIAGYDVPVLNEREVRAAAGILFLFAFMTFSSAWFDGNFRPTKIFVIAFLIDFTIRIFINPKFSPSMIAARFAVRGQAPEWVGAPQKRFAWAIGWLLAVAMLWLIVINNVIGPINLLICGACLLLMFFECAFGICIGCKLYNLLTRQRAQHCAGGSCDVFVPHPSQKVGAGAMALVAAFVALIGLITARGFPAAEALDAQPVMHPMHHSHDAPVSSEADRCKPPAFAVAMGHEEMWKLHNNCK
jgi:hypothetical protein